MGTSSREVPLLPHGESLDALRDYEVERLAAFPVAAAEGWLAAWADRRVVDNVTDTTVLAEQITEALDGGVPLFYAEDRKERRRTAEAALTTLVERLEDAGRERDEWFAEHQNLAADHHFARAKAAEAEVERLREALGEIEQGTYWQGMAEIARIALRDTASGK